MTSNLRILCTGWVCDGDIHLRIPPKPADDTPPDGTLQQIEDDANADVLAEEYQDWFSDDDFNRRGF